MVRGDPVTTPPTKPLTGDLCRCCACGEFFRRTSTFDRHRVGKHPARRCLTVAELYERGFKVDTAGFWRGPGTPVFLAGKGKPAAIGPKGGGTHGSD